MENNMQDNKIGFFSKLAEIIKGSIPESQRNGMEDAMLGIAGGSASAAVAVPVAKAITPELAQIAKNVGSNVPVFDSGSSVLSVPGAARGPRELG